MIGAMSKEFVLVHGMTTYVRAVADATIQAGFSRATVVGHSMGGVVLPGVAGLIPARLARLGFLAAGVPGHGGAPTPPGHITPARRPVMRGLARGGGGAVPVPALFQWARWVGAPPLAA